MFGKTKSLFLIVASMLCMASCDSIREDLPRCELWLEFVFDYNMEYADAFNPQVKSVDVLVFDSDDKLLFTKSVKVAALVGGNHPTPVILCQNPPVSCQRSAGIFFRMQNNRSLYSQKLPQCPQPFAQ